eukprot:gene9338-10944_t
MCTQEIFTGPVFKKNQPDDSYKFQFPPLPTGAYPYHLDLPLSCRNTTGKRLVFNLTGDTGGLKAPAFQKEVALQMAQQYLGPESRPQFLYHLGDIVYHFGEKEQYQKQFFEPYENYPGPIYAIAGNHDADVNPDNPEPYESLDAFYNVFCNTSSRTVYFAGTHSRKSQQQPNVYWTLNTELATIIGLYSNVPKYGSIGAAQRSWFIEELKRAGTLNQEKAIIVCLHHAPYSADTNHASSLPMIRFLNMAFEEAGVYPDVVFSGHVHNYQRFSKIYGNGKEVAFIVAGAGGFDELHTIARTDDPLFTDHSPLLQGVRLEKYCENQHGFLKVDIEKGQGKFRLTCDYYTINQQSGLSEKQEAFDRLTIDLQQDRESEEMLRFAPVPAYPVYSSL